MLKGQRTRVLIVAIIVAGLAAIGTAPAAMADACRDQRRAAEAPVEAQWTTDQQTNGAAKVAAEASYRQAKDAADVTILEAELVYASSAKTADDRRVLSAARNAARAKYKAQNDAYRAASKAYSAWSRVEKAKYRAKMAEIRVAYLECRAAAA
ncbi:MAG: hypothetical protein QG597_3294 [Actinomycetota bacterium]|nr:hypothetical protein [Actinomycetota bacterium]